MSEIRICKYCGMELSEGIPHGLRECHLRAVARIAELEAERRWIPVSERLPLDDGYYWTMDIFKQEQKYKFSQGKWRDQSGMLVEFSATHVTHWMPLPEPPEVQE